MKRSSAAAGCVALLLLCAMAAAVALPAGAAAPPLSPQRKAELETRAKQVQDRREQARRGEGVGAEASHRELVALADTLAGAGLDSLAALMLYRAGALSARLSESARAQAEYQRGIVLATRARARTLEMRLRILLLELMSRTDPEQAVAMLNDVIARLQGPGNEKILADAYSTMSPAYGALGRMPEALEAARQAVRYATFSPQPSDLGDALNALSTNLHAMGREREALAIADSAVRYGEREGLGLPLARAYVSQSNALRELGRSDEAVASINRALALDRRRGDVRHETRTRLIKGHLLFTMERYSAMLAESDTLVGLLRMPGDRLFEPRAIALRALALTELRRYAEAETLLARSLPRFEQLRAEQDDPENSAGLFLRGGESYATWSRDLLGLGRPRQAWRAAERGRAWVLRSQLGAESESRAAAELRDVQHQLATSGAALLQYTDPQRNPLCAFIVTGDSLNARWLGRGLLANDARLVIELFAENAPHSLTGPPLERLAQALLKDVLPRVPAGITRLWIIPPSQLSGFPFEALPIPGSPRAGETLGDRFAISYLPSASALMVLAARTPSSTGMTVFADPSLSKLVAPMGVRGVRVRELAATPLPGAREEAKRIAPRGATVYRGRDASRANLESAATRQSSVLHFATHALLDPGAPEASGLLLAGADGIVAAAAVESLTLRCDLVALSGCRTIGGGPVLGEGIFGLSRSFLLAGARSVVTSLWDVGDHGAAQFMGYFYDALRAGSPRDVALQRARRQMLSAGGAERDAYGFVLHGLGTLPVPALATATAP